MDGMGGKVGLASGPGSASLNGAARTHQRVLEHASKLAVAVRHVAGLAAPGVLREGVDDVGQAAWCRYRKGVMGARQVKDSRKDGAA